MVLGVIWRFAGGFRWKMGGEVTILFVDEQAGRDSCGRNGANTTTGPRQRPYVMTGEANEDLPDLSLPVSYIAREVIGVHCI